MKNVLMDVVVEDIAPRFGMLLSRSWVEIERDTTARFLLCNDSGVWPNEEIVSGTKNEIHDHKQGETNKSSV